MGRHMHQTQRKTAHDGDALSVDGCSLCVLKFRDQVALSGLLERQQGVQLPAIVGLDAVGQFAHQALKRRFSEQ